MKQFRILTQLTCDYVNAMDDEKLQMALYNEQEAVLAKYGFHMGDYVWATNGYQVTICTIDQAIESMLSMKEGGDLVQFDNGRIGFVGYYGMDRTYFEIIQHSSKEEQMDMVIGIIAIKA